MHTTTNIFENSSYNKMCKRWSNFQNRMRVPILEIINIKQDICDVGKLHMKPALMCLRPHTTFGGKFVF